MSVRETILGNFETQLATILTSGGYESDVSEVLRNVPHSEDLANSINQTVIVLDDSGTDETVGYFESNKTLAEMTIALRCYTRATRTDGPTTNIGKVIADVKELIDAPISLGSNCRYAKWTDIETAVLTDRVGIVRITVAILYWYTRTAA